MYRHRIVIQILCEKNDAPRSITLKKWARAALDKRIHTSEVTLRIVTVEEMAELNMVYRKKMGPTNVLSFPLMTSSDFASKDLDLPILGDIVICAEVVNREASEQGKTLEAHWAHMVVHGIFHLLGYDHEIDSEALVMEALETETMQLLGYDDPYATEKKIHNE